MATNENLIDLDVPSTRDNTPESKTINVGNGLVAIPHAYAPVFFTKNMASKSSSINDENRTIFEISNFDNFPELKVRAIGLLILCQSGASECNEDSKYRGICSDYNCDGVRIGDFRFLNDGTPVLIICVLAVEDASTTPFNYLVLVGEIKDEIANGNIFLVSNTSIMSLKNEG